MPTRCPPPFLPPVPHVWEIVEKAKILPELWCWWWRRRRRSAPCLCVWCSQEFLWSHWIASTSTSLYLSTKGQGITSQDSFDTHCHKNLRSHISAKINNICDKDVEHVSWKMSVKDVSVHWYNYVPKAVYFKHKWQPSEPNTDFCHHQKSCDQLEHMYCHLHEYKSNLLQAKYSRSWNTKTLRTAAPRDRLSNGTCLPFWSHHNSCMSWGMFPVTRCCSGRNSHGTFSPSTAVHEWSLQLQSGLLPEKEPFLQ